MIGLPRALRSRCEDGDCKPREHEVDRRFVLAAIGDVAHPTWRASAAGVYRLWRDLGYAIGGIIAGVCADALGVDGAIWLVALITLASGVLAGLRMSETLAPPAHR